MQTEISSILIVFNPAAQGGATAAVLEEYKRFLHDKGIAYYCYITLGQNDAEHLHTLLQNNEFKLISIIGGDGTINLTINALPRLNIPFHLIPSGSGNDLAKMIYPDSIPTYHEIFKRILAKTPKTKSIDIWRCNDQLFANGFGCGFDGSIAYDTKFKKGLLGTKMKYWVEIVKHIFFYTSPDISVNGKAYATFMLSAANGSVYGGDFKVAPNASISDGKLDIVRIKKVWVPLRLFYLPLVIMGKHLGTSIAEHEQLDQLTIVANKPIPAHLDGEPMSKKEYIISKECKMEVLC
jgi:diacylglycerol kinase family enzyme